MRNCRAHYDLALHASWGKRLRRALPFIRGPRVLEVSCGLGYLLSQYAAKFEVTAVDYNPDCVAHARARLQRLGLHATVREADAHALPFPDASFDTLVNTDSFSLYHDPELALKEALRVLVPGGRIVLLEYDDPSNGNLLGKIWAWNARHIVGMPRFDSKGLLASAGLPYEDHALGGFGAFHMFIMDKPVASLSRDPQSRATPVPMLAVTTSHEDIARAH